MDEKEMYTNSWAEQRQREAASTSQNFFQNLKKSLTLTRYDIAHRMMRCNKGGVFLDVGCGRGEILFMAEDIFDDIYGLDIADDELRRIEEQFLMKKERKVSLLSCNLNKKWPVESERFDVITCIAVLEHLFDPYAIVAEFNRVLRPDGILIVEVPNIAYLKYRFNILLGKFPGTSGDEAGWDGGHLHYFTVSSLRALLNDNGFECLSIRGSGCLAS